MKKINNEKGAITLVVLISVLFLVTFLTSTYIILSNKAKVQEETIKMIKNQYEEDKAEDVYSKYIGEGVIPIYTVKNLLSIGTEEDISIKEAKGRFYNFSNTASYILMNDLEFDVNDEQDLLGGVFTWNPPDEDTNFLGTFEWNGKKITVKEADDEINVYSYYKAPREDFNLEEPIL